ncbi:MAG: hypothetical protein MUO50_04880 [Longimicrobiales bacterium]|nr:hypothetical protein [Longimicrobiales bacterium]
MNRAVLPSAPVFLTLFLAASWPPSVAVRWERLSRVYRQAIRPTRLSDYLLQR